MPPDRIDHITQSITQALLDATSAESQAEGQRPRPIVHERDARSLPCVKRV